MVEWQALAHGRALVRTRRLDIMAQPIVSIIIPTYNCAQYIAETITSVLNQSFKDIELIVVDDGSIDSTRDIVASINGPIRLIPQTNAGVCVARNRGISEATGRYICLMDHDDYWFPHKLERQVALLDEQPEIGVVYSSFILWHRDESNGLFPSAESFDLNHYADDFIPEFSGWIYHQFLLDCWMLTSTAMFRAEIFEECGAFDEDLPYSEDWDLWLRISRRYPFIQLRRPSTLYRQHAHQGNRVNRAIDYRTRLLRQAVEKWGFCSRDGRCLPREEFNRKLATYHAEFGLGHLRAGNKKQAVSAFLKSWMTYPQNLRTLAYVPATLMGWRPQW